MHARDILAQSTPKFELASLKLSKTAERLSARLTARKWPKGGGGGAPSTGRLHTCATLEGLIQGAYVVYADGHSNRTRQARLFSPPISGGPAWIHSDRYMIDAKPEGAPGQEMMNGPMMQALLEDRFQLRIHHENQEVPVYDLTVAKGGPKLQPFQEGSCIPIDLTTKLPTPLPPEGQKYCGGVSFGPVTGPLIPFHGQALSLDHFAKLIGWAVDRPVIDKDGDHGPV